MGGARRGVRRRQRQFKEAAKGLKAQLLEIEGKFVNLDASKSKPGEAQRKEKLGALSGMIDESDDIDAQLGRSTASSRTRRTSS
ncbi:MAG: hypothetical protein U0841_13830 [Chloroflexia bacterium]